MEGRVVEDQYQGLPARFPSKGSPQRRGFCLKRRCRSTDLFWNQGRALGTYFQLEVTEPHFLLVFVQWSWGMGVAGGSRRWVCVEVVRNTQGNIEKTK